MTLRLRVIWLIGLFLAATFVRAAEPAGEPTTAHQVVLSTTKQVMSVVAEADTYVEQDPDRYYSEVQAILDPVIDYRGFARGVMGPYATSERYRALDEAGRAQLREQLDRFTEIMRVGLVRTYSKGLLAFGGSRVEVPPPAEGELGGSKVSVRQLVYAEEAEPYVLLYQMGRNKSGEWKLRNVIIESVNLGEIYRNQFQAAAREHDGNLDAVINSWTAVEVDA